MTTITIKYTNYMPSFKQIHDLIMDNEGCIIEFEEMDDGVNPSSIFIIANLLQVYGRDKYKSLRFISNKNELTDNLEPDILFRGIPFDEVILNDKIFKLNERI